MNNVKRKRLDYRKSTPAPLIIVAGLPNPLSVTVAKYLELKFIPEPKTIQQPSGNLDSGLYRPGTVESLLSAVSAFAERQRKAQPEVTVPSFILLAYVPSPDEEQLLKAFEYFVFPVRLSRLADYDARGRQMRHDLALAQEYVLSSLQIAFGEFREIKRRLSSPSDKEPLFLPPNNFRTLDEGRVAALFSGLVRQRLAWNDLVKTVKSTQVTNQDLPSKVARGATKTILQDARGLFFPRDLSFHGVPREIEQNSSVQERQLHMKSSFRFGVPLPDGFHHDAQFAGRDLASTVFECCKAGVIQPGGSHANIYPNDFVRPVK